MVLRLCFFLWLVLATPAYAFPKGDVALLTPIEIQCEQQKDTSGVVDAFVVHTNTESLVCDVACQAYARGTDWQEWTHGGQQTGKRGERIEAIRMHLRGLAARDYRLWYRVKVRKLGWTNWACDGSPAGTMGMSLPIRGVQVALRHTYERPPKTTGDALLDNTIYEEIEHIPNRQSIVTTNGFVPSKKTTKEIKAAIRDVRKQGYDVGFVMMDLATHQGLAYNCGTLFYGASSIKAPYMAAAIESHPEALKRFKRQIQETLTCSWDDTYKEITEEYGEEPLFEWVDELELESDFKTFVPERPWAGYTARDFAKMWIRIHQWSLCSKDGRTFCSWSEHPQTSTIHHVLGGRYKTQSKAGWIQDDYSYWNVTNDGGIVYADNGPYVLAIMSSVPADFSKLHNLTRALDHAHGEILVAMD